MQGRRNLFEIDTLEQRLLLAAAPAQPRANSLGKAFDAGERQILLDRLGNMNAADHKNLQNKLNTSIAKFDDALLDYMRTRNGPKFFFDPAKVDQLGQFITNNDISYVDIQEHSDAITDSHLFPDQNSS